MSPPRYSNFLPAKHRARREFIPRLGDGKLRGSLEAGLYRAIGRGDEAGAIEYARLLARLVNVRADG